MRHLSLGGYCLLLLSLLTPVYSHTQKHSHAKRSRNSADDPELSHWVSRPDLVTPKWNLKVYREDLLDASPGHWFVAPYMALDNTAVDEPWVGPTIYDGRTGDLIWSGGVMFNRGNFHDFRISNVKGEELLTVLSQGRGEAMILGSDYEVRQAVHLDHPSSVNTHELHFVDEGEKALVIKNTFGSASRNDSMTVGYDGHCKIHYDQFEELDVGTWNRTFRWRTKDHLSISETTYGSKNISSSCGHGWDPFHTNSVDKTPEGDYLYSLRHMDAILKISGKDGSIIWQLGGIHSNFALRGDMVFGRQHDVRYRGQNGTHFFVSIMDNAKGLDSRNATHEFSRGLLFALDERNMTAHLERHYNHPDGKGNWAWRRGNYQVLPNGNVFLGWSEQALQSEHTADGHLIWSARLAVDWLGSYRNYKFPWVGNPIDPPVAVANAYGSDENETTTEVHVSWNGATEVAKYRLYRTNANGQTKVLIGTSKRTGFETAIHYDGYVSYVQVEALDKHNKVLGQTDLAKTTIHGDISPIEVADEDQWLQDYANEKSNLLSKAKSIIRNPVAAFVFGCACSAVMLVVGWQVKQQSVLQRYFGTVRYDRLGETDADQDDMPLRHKEHFKRPPD